jgi:hypothetical protein
MDGPAEFAELDLDLFERCDECAATVRAAGAFGEDTFTLQLKFMTPALALGLFLVRCVIAEFLRRRFGRRCFGLLLFHGLTFPTLGHISIVRNAATSHLYRIAKQLHTQTA